MWDFLVCATILSQQIWGMLDPHTRKQKEYNFLHFPSVIWGLPDKQTGNTLAFAKTIEIYPGISLILTEELYMNMHRDILYKPSNFPLTLTKATSCNLYTNITIIGTWTLKMFPFPLYKQYSSLELL